MKYSGARDKSVGIDLGIPPPMYLTSHQKNVLHQQIRMLSGKSKLKRVSCSISLQGVDEKFKVFEVRHGMN